MRPSVLSHGCNCAQLMFTMIRSGSPLPSPAAPLCRTQSHRASNATRKQFPVVQPLSWPAERCAAALDCVEPTRRHPKPLLETVAGRRGCFARFMRVSRLDDCEPLLRIRFFTVCISAYARTRGAIIVVKRTAKGGRGRRVEQGLEAIGQVFGKLLRLHCSRIYVRDSEWRYRMGGHFLAEFARPRS